MIMMKNLRLLVVLVGVTLVAAPVASAQLLDENFDSLDVGTNMHNVEGWEGWYGNESAGGYVTADQAYSGNRSLECSSPIDAAPHWKRITSGSWTLTTMQYVPSTSTSGITYYNVMHSYEPSTSGSAGWLFEAILDLATGDIRISDDVRLPLVRDAWAEIRVELNFDSNVSNFYYNGALLGTSYVEGLAAINPWTNNGDVIYYDDIILFSLDSQ